MNDLMFFECSMGPWDHGHGPKIEPATRFKQLNEAWDIINRPRTSQNGAREPQNGTDAATKWSQDPKNGAHDMAN